MKLYVNNQGKILGPLDWEKILFAAKKGRFAEDVTVSDDRVNWLSFDDARKLIEESKSLEQKNPVLGKPFHLRTTSQDFLSASQQTDSSGTQQPGYPGAPQPGYPGAPQAGYPGAPQTGYPGAPQTGYPGAPQTGYPGAPQAGYPGAPQAGYPGVQQPGYPGAPQTGYPGAPQANGTWNGVLGTATNGSRQPSSQSSSLGVFIAIIAFFVAVGGVGSVYYYLNRSAYNDISKHIDLWLKAVQNGDGVSAYATDLDIPYSPVSWKIITDKSEFKASKETYEVKLLMESSNKGGIPIRATWTLIIRKDKNRKTGYVITYVDVHA